MIVACLGHTSDMSEGHTHFRGGSRISGKGIYMYIGVGGSLCLFYLIFLIYPMKMKLFGLTETKLFPFHETKIFHFHRIFH